MDEVSPTVTAIELAQLGERLSRLRLRSPEALREMERSLSRHGQLVAVVCHRQDEKVEVVDGFKRLIGARAPPSALPPLPATRPSVLDVHQDFIRDLLVRFPDITARRVYEELCARVAPVFEGRYTIVKALVRKLRPKPAVEPSYRHRWRNPSRARWPSATGRPSCSVSRMAHGTDCRSSAIPSRIAIDGIIDFMTARTFMRCSMAMSRHSTISRVLLQSASMMPEDGGTALPQPIYNPRFVAFATYYRFQPWASRPGHPNDKPHVELSFRSLRISFFNGRDFHDLDDLKAQLARWSTGIDDERPQRKKQRRTPLELHAEEQPALIARPGHVYDTARVVYRVCDLEGFVAWDGNRYSLPAENVTELLPVRITQTEIFVYGQDLQLVAQHELRPRGAGELVIGIGKYTSLKSLDNASRDAEHVAQLFKEVRVRVGHSVARQGGD